MERRMVSVIVVPLDGASSSYGRTHTHTQFLLVFLSMFGNILSDELSPLPCASPGCSLLRVPFS